MSYAVSQNGIIFIVGEHDLIEPDLTKEQREAVLKAVNDPSSIQRWIPVSEQLPKGSGKYCVTFPHGEVGSCFYCKQFGFHSDYDSHIAVTAWQPLPEPYKETK